MAMRMFIYPLFAWMFTTRCYAQVVNRTTPQAGIVADARTAFKRLNEYLTCQALNFLTTYDARNKTLGSSRGSAHFLIQRPNLLRVEISGPDFSYLLISDGQVFAIYDRKTFTQFPARDTPLEALNLFTGLTAVQAQVLRAL
jgi:outer membrane lipoprotein-sorting protein